MPSFNNERKILTSRHQLEENQRILTQITRPEEIGVELSDELIVRLNLERKRVSSEVLIQHQHQAEQQLVVNQQLAHQVQQDVELDLEVEQEAVGRPLDRSSTLRFDDISKRQRRRSETVRNIYQHFFGEDDDYEFDRAYRWMRAARPVNQAKHKLTEKGKLLLEHFNEGQSHCGSNCKSRDHERRREANKFQGRLICEEHIGQPLVLLADILDFLYVQGIHTLSEDSIAEIVNHFEDYKIGLDLNNLPRGFYVDGDDDARTLRFSPDYQPKKKCFQVALENKVVRREHKTGVLYQFYQQLVDASEELDNLTIRLSRHFGGDDDSKERYLELLFSHYDLVAKLNRLPEKYHDSFINVFIDVTNWGNSFDEIEAEKNLHQFILFFEVLENYPECNHQFVVRRLLPTYQQGDSEKKVMDLVKGCRHSDKNIDQHLLGKMFNCRSLADFDCLRWQHYDAVLRIAVQYGQEGIDKLAEILGFVQSIQYSGQSYLYNFVDVFFRTNAIESLLNSSIYSYLSRLKDISEKSPGLFSYWVTLSSQHHPMNSEIDFIQLSEAFIQFAHAIERKVTLSDVPQCCLYGVSPPIKRGIDAFLERHSRAFSSDKEKVYMPIDVAVVALDKLNESVTDFIAGDKIDNPHFKLYCVQSSELERKWYLVGKDYDGNAVNGYIDELILQCPQLIYLQSYLNNVVDADKMIESSGDARVGRAERQDALSHILLGLGYGIYQSLPVTLHRLHTLMNSFPSPEDAFFRANSASLDIMSPDREQLAITRDGFNLLSPEMDFDSPSYDSHQRKTYAVSNSDLLVAGSSLPRAKDYGFRYLATHDVCAPIADVYQVLDRLQPPRFEFGSEEDLDKWDKMEGGDRRLAKNLKQATPVIISAASNRRYLKQDASFPHDFQVFRDAVYKFKTAQDAKTVLSILNQGVLAQFVIESLGELVSIFSSSRGRGNIDLDLRFRARKSFEIDHDKKKSFLLQMCLSLLVDTKKNDRRYRHLVSRVEKLEEKLCTPWDTKDFDIYDYLQDEAESIKEIISELHLLLVDGYSIELSPVSLKQQADMTCLAAASDQESFPEFYRLVNKFGYPLYCVANILRKDSEAKVRESRSKVERLASRFINEREYSSEVLEAIRQGLSQLSPSVEYFDALSLKEYNKLAKKVDERDEAQFGRDIKIRLLIIVSALQVPHRSVQRIIPGSYTTHTQMLDALCHLHLTNPEKFLWVSELLAFSAIYTEEISALQFKKILESESRAEAAEYVDRNARDIDPALIPYIQKSDDVYQALIDSVFEDHLTHAKKEELRIFLRKFAVTRSDEAFIKAILNDLFSLYVKDPDMLHAILNINASSLSINLFLGRFSNLLKKFRAHCGHDNSLFTLCMFVEKSSQQTGREMDKYIEGTIFEELLKHRNLKKNAIEIFIDLVLSKGTQRCFLDLFRILLRNIEDQEAATLGLCQCLTRHRIVVGSPEACLKLESLLENDSEVLEGLFALFDQFPAAINSVFDLIPTREMNDERNRLLKAKGKLPVDFYRVQMKFQNVVRILVTAIQASRVADEHDVLRLLAILSTRSSHEIQALLKQYENGMLLSVGDILHGLTHKVPCAQIEPQCSVVYASYQFESVSQKMSQMLAAEALPQGNSLNQQQVRQQATGVPRHFRNQIVENFFLLDAHLSGGKPIFLGKYNARALRKCSRKELVDYSKDLSKKINDERISKDDRNVYRLYLLAVLIVAVERTNHYQLNTTQILRLIYSCLYSDYRDFYNIPTGEGKSAVDKKVVSAFYILSHQEGAVNNATSNALLTDRDFKASKAFFSYLFGPESLVRVSANTSSAEYNRAKVRFGSFSDFGLYYSEQRRLQTEEDLSSGFKHDLFLCDEFDDLALRPQPTLQVSRAQASQSINDYEELVCQFLDTGFYKSTQHDVALLMKSLIKFIHSRSTVQKVFSEEEMIALHKLVVSFEVAEKLRLGIDYVIETSERVNEWGCAETVRKVIVLVGDEPKPESRFSFNVHSAKVARLNHQAVQNGERDNFEVEPDGEVISSISCLTYLKKYKHIVGFSGTTCKGQPLAFIEGDCCLTVHAIPPNKASLRKDLDPVTCRNDTILFETLYEKLAHPQAGPQLLLLKDARKLLEFQEFLKTKPKLMLRVNFLQGDLSVEEKERIQRCGGQEIVIATPIAERGLDLDSDKLAVIQAYPCASDSREQAKGRTARNGRAGSYQQIVSKTDLPEGADLDSYQMFLDYQQIYHQTLCFQKDKIKDSYLTHLFNELHTATSEEEKEKIERVIIKFIYHVESKWQTLVERLNYKTNWHDSYDENVLQFKTIIAFFKKDLEQFLQEVNAEYSLSIPVGETSFVDVSDAEESDTENLEDDDLSEEEERVPELTDRFKSFTKKNSHQRRNTVHRLVGEQDPTLRVLHDGTQGEEISKLNESLYRHNHETFMDRMIPWDRLRKSAKQAAEQASVDSLLERIKQGFQKGTNFKYLKEKISQFALLLEGVEEDVRQYYIEKDLLSFILQQYLLNQIDFTQAMQLITVLCQHAAFSLDGELTMPESIQNLCRSDFWDRLVSSNRAPSHCINAIRQANPPMTLQAIQELIRSRPFSSRLARSHYVQSLYDCILNVSDDSSPVATQIMLDSFAIKLKSEYDGAHGVHRKYKSSICFKSKGAAASQRMEQSVTPFVDCTLTLPKARKQPLTYQDFVEQGETLLIELSKHLERIGREESMVEKELEEMKDEYFSFEKESSGRKQLEVFKEQRDAIEQVVSLTYEEVSTVKKAMKKGEVYSYNRYQPSQFLADRLSTLGSEKVDKGFNCIDQLDPSLSSGPRTFLQHLKHLFSRLLSGKKRPPVNDSLSMLKCSFHSVIHKGAPGAVDDESQQPTTSGLVH